jgi:oxygen-independent coproporphyrinogen III oxidase
MSQHMSRVRVDLDLVRKYNQAGPRYTSYPPATRFGSVDKDMLLARIRQSNQTNSSDLSLYFHLPFCRSLCWYCGCTTIITTQQNQSAAYLRLLDQEMDIMGGYIHPERKVVQLHFGGGTPTFLFPEELRALGGMIRRRFSVAPNAEFGVEIDPRRLTKNHIDALREIGCNRVSLGVQDHNPQVQLAIHRIQPREVTEQAIQWAREAGIKMVNIDLIYGLPHQTPATFERTLDEVLELEPDRLAVFSYAHVPWIKPAQKILETEKLPSAETKLELLKLTIEKLTANDRYVYIGMDHFARPDDELTIAQRNKTLQRNFQGYSTCGNTDIYSFGISSISQGADAYWQNYKDIGAYGDAVAGREAPIERGYALSGEDILRRKVIMRLMCDLELDYAALSTEVGVDVARHFKTEIDSLSDLEADGLVERGAKGLRVTQAGRLFIRNVAMRFDAYLPTMTERRFSRTV